MLAHISAVPFTFAKTPDQNWAFSTGTEARATVPHSLWVAGPSEAPLEVTDPCSRNADTRTISLANSGSFPALVRRSLSQGNASTGLLGICVRLVLGVRNNASSR